MGKWWTGFANYTYSVSTSGYFGTRRIYEDPSEQRKYYQYRPIPQPYARFNLNFKIPKKLGPKIFGSHPFDDMQAILIGDWASGYWDTWNPRGLPGIGSNVHYKDWFDISLRINKQIYLKKMDISVFVEISNLLNTKRLNLNSFMDSHDEQFYFQSLHLPESNVYDNIPGNDRPGDYRNPGTPYQPIERIGSISSDFTGDSGVIYWERTSGKYMEFKEGSWMEVENARIQDILKTKAYIDMPNMSSFNFLNPRRITVGIRTNFNF